MTNTIAVKDPLCGMEVEAATAAVRSEHKGQTYYFCGSRCKEKFDHNPQQYTGTSAGKPQSGHGCCS
jgi:Cu+-exporting ATPase